MPPTPALDVDNGPLRDRVRLELQLRGESARVAAGRAVRPSSATWSQWLRGSIPLRPVLAAGIARAFDWPARWWVDPPAVCIDQRLGAALGPVTLQDIADKLDHIAALLEGQNGDSTP